MRLAHHAAAWNMLKKKLMICVVTDIYEAIYFHINQGE